MPAGTRVSSALLAAVGALVLAAPALAADPVLDAASYPDATTYNCATDPIPIYPGQNLNLYGLTKTCPNAQRVSGPGDTSVFAGGSTAEGYVTRFKPSMVEVHEDGSADHPERLGPAPPSRRLALPGGFGYGTGEEKTEWKMPQGYGFQVGGDATWGINYMIHNLTATSGRQVEITWQIDWVPETSPCCRTDIHPLKTVGLDVAGTPHVYPVFDAERGFDRDGDGKYTFPDEVPTDPIAARLRGARQHQQRRQVDRPRRRPHARLGRRPPAPGRPVHGHDRSPAMALMPARPRATTRPRSQAAVQIRRPLLRAGGRGELGRRDDCHAPRLARPPEGRRRRLGQRDLRRPQGVVVRVDGPLPARGQHGPTTRPRRTRSTTRRPSRRCTTRAAS